MQLSRGLATSAGPQALSLPHGEVVSVERIVGQSKHVVVRCRGALDSLGSWRSTRSHNWNGDVPVYRILADVCALAGVRLDTAGAVSSQSARQPAFITGPNESGREIARRLLDLAPERCRPVEALLALTDPRSQPSPYAYGYSGHPLYSWDLRDGPVDPNHVQVYGRSSGGAVYGDALDSDEAARVGHRVLKLTDPAVSLAADATGRAEARLVVVAREARSGRLEGPPHLGVELWDEASVQPAPTGPAVVRTVTAYEERYDPSRAEWRQAIHLGGE